MKVRISKYMSYFNLFIGFLLIIFSIINDLGIVFLLIGAFAVLVSSASIYLKSKIAIQEKIEDKK